MSILSSVLEVIYQDFLSGRVPIPLELKTLEDEHGFSSEIIQLSKDIRLVFDDGSVLDFKAGSNINDVSSRAELFNDSLVISVEDITVFDPSKTIDTTLIQLFGDGFFDGFQEWWFVTRTIGKETFQFLRFNLKVELENGVYHTFEAGTRWTECIYELERNGQKNTEFKRPEFQTVSCVRKCYSPTVPLVNPNDIPKDLLDDVQSIMDLDD